MRGRILKDEFGHGEHAARLLREATADHVCDIAIAGAQDDFRFRSAMIPLDGAMLIESNFGSYSNERTPRHIARGGMDPTCHALLQRRDHVRRGGAQRDDATGRSLSAGHDAGKPHAARG